jgi:ADP-ribose pyrophosphatase YjhB (NUDIX family)
VAKFVRYGPAPRYGLPDAGFCASSFVIVRSGTTILAGIPKDDSKWREEWAPNFLVYSKSDLAAEFRLWRLPATYLLEGEHPDAAADRVLRDQLTLPARPLHHPDVYTFHDPSTWFPGKRHYDLCFVYEIRGPAPSEMPPWWQRLEFVDPMTLKKAELGSAMSDLVRVLPRMA